MKVQIDRDVCIGIGNCVAMAPSVFKLDSENKAVVLDAGSVDLRTLLEAAKSCPVSAIAVEDEDGRQIYP
jgi:ferredoxin